MSSESILRAWLDDLLGEVALLDDTNASRPSPEKPEPPVSSDPRADDLPEDIRSAMDTLRLCVKYIVFDNQASRRQNAYLSRMIEQCYRRHGET